ncbi:MAG: gamma-glutamyl-gamma-aminobutyrate hydrolase family protein [Candidatus Dormibacteraeota bacterium]|nr:gamma-glutamyl-gamma-aminobutyrate hydrolase family protein [Candidatus Dormibacteraeota bacterium]
MSVLVGVSTYLESAAWGAWSRPAALLPTTYVDAVRGGGGVPVLLPPIPDAAAALVEHLDALVLAGGNDLDPASYGAQAHPATANTRPERDAAELALVRAALQRNLPVLAICRGMQLLNVAAGGDLIQHLPDLLGDERHQPKPGSFAVHEVRLSPGSRAAAVLGDSLEVASCHHQGVGRLGDGLSVSGRAPDGVVEAIEMQQRDFVLGVQWHPEEHAGRDGRLFTALVEAARPAAVGRP